MDFPGVKCFAGVKSFPGQGRLPGQPHGARTITTSEAFDTADQAKLTQARVRVREALRDLRIAMICGFHIFKTTYTNIGPGPGPTKEYV